MFDIRRISVHSLKDFVREYLMIVIGILTALGLEHLVTSEHHARDAEQSRQRIVAEIRANLEEVRDAQAQNATRLGPIDAEAAVLRKEIEEGMPRAEINRRLLDQIKGKVVMGYTWPTLRHEAWDVVVANQSASYIDADALRRYSAAYAAQRDSSVLGLHGAESLLNGTRVLDAFADLQLQRADPVEFLKVLGHESATVTAVQSVIGDLRKQLEAALAGEAAGDATGTAAPAAH
jgi:hypothetical protein